MRTANQINERPSVFSDLGFELAGEILSVGKEVKKFVVGDRVLALKTGTSGAFAQKCLVDENGSNFLDIFFNCFSAWLDFFF